MRCVVRNNYDCQLLLCRCARCCVLAVGCIGATLRLTCILGATAFGHCCFVSVRQLCPSATCLPAAVEQQLYCCHHSRCYHRCHHRRCLRHCHFCCCYCCEGSFWRMSVSVLATVLADRITDAQLCALAACSLQHQYPLHIHPARAFI